MQRFISSAFFAAVFGTVLVAALPSRTVVAAGVDRFAVTEIEDQAVRQADHALLQAIAKGDKPAADALLDADFTWTDHTGKTRTRAEILQDLPALAAESDTDLQVRDYDQVILVRGAHRISSRNLGVRFVRAWVKRPAGWRVLVYQETKIAEHVPEHRQGFGSPSGGAPVDCDNPCQTVPYKPEDPAAREVVAMWQAVERSVLDNDVDAWIPNFTDDFIFVTPDGGPPLDKADRIAMIKELKRTSTVLIPPKVQSMQVWPFGNSAVMRSEHRPRSGKTLHVTRVFVKREGHWQIAFGQQTTMEPSPSASQ
ncbi:MAG: nuclear transport factor 2 family protein [Acidobacteriia bacterium]|nr:nuclear transport factor 2 family protein [Terriglobia bacterium]